MSLRSRRRSPDGTPFTVTDRDALIVEAKGACFVCRREFDGKTVKPCVDHDHATGVVRGRAPAPARSLDLVELAAERLQT